MSIWEGMRTNDIRTNERVKIKEKNQEEKLDFDEIKSICSSHGMVAFTSYHLKLLKRSVSASPQKRQFDTLICYFFPASSLFDNKNSGYV